MSGAARFFITFLFGALGVHKFLQHKYFMGIIYLFTGGLFGIGWFIDTIIAAVAWATGSNDLGIGNRSNYDQGYAYGNTTNNYYNYAPPAGGTGYAAPNNGAGYSQPNYRPADDYVQLTAVGAQYYMDNIRRLASPDSDYTKSPETLIAEGKAGRRIYENYYAHNIVDLVPEQSNTYDVGDIAVRFNGSKVGSIAKGDLPLVRELMQKNITVTGFIVGGNYKVVDENGRTYEDSSSITVQVEIRVM